MDEIVQKAIQQAEALKTDPGSVPWKSDEPWPQAYHSWNAEKEEWQPTESSTSHSTGISTLALFSWNIDFMLPFPESRMDAALAHLEALTSQPLSTATTAVVINLQECTPSDLITIGQKQWIRDNFYVTDIDSSAWASGAYGTTSLVDRRLEISSCFRVHYSKTQMQRDALFVNVAVPTATPGHGKQQQLRLCNTHLESLAREPPLRPSQMQLVASYMRANAGCRWGAIATGDFNAIQAFDETLHSDNGLKDAYLELGGRENSDEGYTWGQQALPELRRLYGCSRMDKVYFCGEGLELLSLERFGADVEIHEREEEQRSQLLDLGFEKPWVTDHLGVKAVFALTNDLRS
ncbi:endonuclease/exonuclease/phosphatase family protein [Xylariaceae sp. FL0662B]|nr:endonuclease/exonuclease/phosphatase family protein [Xylariaceae sp. FL0662B]